MTTIMTPEIEAIDLAEFEYTRPCTPGNDEKCDRNAGWLLVKMCGCEIPLCEQHKQEAEAWVARNLGGSGKCVLCGHKHVQGEWWHRAWIKL